jgi:hypothetical protein
MEWVRIKKVSFKVAGFFLDATMSRLVPILSVVLRPIILG